MKADLKKLITEIQENIEYLETSEPFGDIIECISIENLEGILTRWFNELIKLSENQ
jgi:hypothetical protein